jgi:N-acetylglucosaminyldiphosphoundecaprenol N-acetyl-beta-D-mannosaminyltransferase
METTSHNLRANVLGIGVSATDMNGALATIASAIEAGSKGYVCATGVHGVMEAQRDPALRSILNNSFLNLADGRPTMWVGRIQGLRSMRQVTGPNLMLRLCELSAKTGYTHFFYGGDVGVAEQLKDAMTKRFPGLKVVGTYTPPFRPLRPEEAAELSDMVSRLKPDVFWVGLSTPKQERWVAEYVDRLDTKLMFAVGAAFDMHTGRIKESPEWLKVMGLQWLHRLCQEPRRLWKRYLISNSRFIPKILLQFLGVRKYEPVAEHSVIMPQPAFRKKVA